MGIMQIEELLEWKRRRRALVKTEESYQGLPHEPMTRPEATPLPATCGSEKGGVAVVSTVDTKDVAEDSEELAKYIQMTEYIRTRLARNRNSIPEDKNKYKRKRKARHGVKRETKSELHIRAADGCDLPVVDGGDSRKLYIETEPLPQRVSEGFVIPPTVYEPISREECEIK